MAKAFQRRLGNCATHIIKQFVKVQSIDMYSSSPPASSLRNTNMRHVLRL